jgi:hypothetical protein
LKAEAQAAVAKVETLNSKLAEHGGIEAVAPAMEIFDKLVNGRAVEVINELPAHIRNGVQKQVFEAALSQEANRVLGVNSVLKADFGLEKDLPKQTMEKLFEFAAYRLNTDADDFTAFLDRELELVNTPEKEVERLRAENERLKTKPADAEAKAEGTETDEQILARIQTTYDDYSDQTFDRLSQAELKAYGLEASSKDTPAVKTAKETVLAMIREYVGVEMRKAKAFQPLFPYWLSGDTDNSWYRQAEGTYERVMQLKVQQAFKSISKLLNVSRPASQGPSHGGGTGTRREASDGYPAGEEDRWRRRIPRCFQGSSIAGRRLAPLLLMCRVTRPISGEF